MKVLSYIILLSLFSRSVYAYHIVGGEMIYDYLGNDQYRITLKIYRDCGANNPFASPFDGIGNAGPAYITVYDALNNVIGVYNIGIPVVSQVPPAFNNICIQTPNTTCVEEGTYEYTLSLTPMPGGYTVVYQRCCRNAAVVNIANPVFVGSTYYTKIPGAEDAAVNSSPRFTKFPPIYICNNVNFKFDHSAIDPDGDNLVYSLCAPFEGLDGCCASVGQATPAATNTTCISPPLNCPQAGSAPPFTNVLFNPPFSGSYPIPSNPAFSINPVTGHLTGTPTMIAQYVVGVCIQEFRGNKLINTHFRDFQFTVVPCTVAVQSVIADHEEQCQGMSISFTNKSINNSANPVYHWDFGVQGITSDTSALFSPVYVYPDTGIYMVTLVSNPGKPCTDTLKKTVYVYPPLNVHFRSPQRQCFLNNSFEFKTEGQFLPQTTYEWHFGDSAAPSVAALKDPSGIHFTQPGLYTVELVAKQFACRDTFADTVRVIPRPKARINNIQSMLCDPALVGFSNGSISELPVSYVWTFSNGKSSTSFETSQVFSPAGTYAATLVITTKTLCTDTSVAVFPNIVVSPKPVPSFTFDPHETSIFEPVVKITSTTGKDVVSTTFQFGDGTTSELPANVHTYQDAGKYRITQIVTNEHQCVDSLSDTVRILPEFRFWIPNGFSPDGNDLNDRFVPVTIGVKSFEFEIFNRWGESVYFTSDSDSGWNGSFNGKDCPQGVYTWKISYTNVVSGEMEMRLGHVLLVRNP